MKSFSSSSRPDDELARLRAQVSLLDAQRARMARLAETMNALSQLSVEINAMDADAIKDLAVTRIPSLVKARSAALFSADPVEGALLLERHTDPKVLEYSRRVPAGADTLLARAIQSQEILLVHDLEAYAQALDGPLRQCSALVGMERACLISPLRSGQSLVGVLALMDREDGGSFDAVNDIPPIQQISQLLGSALRNLQLYAQVLGQSRLDSLTGTLNRRALWDGLERAMARALAENRSLSLLMMDLDNFKQVNDTYGHWEGDAVLLAVVEAMRGTLGSADLLGRYGGDEFIAVVPDLGLEAARALGARLLEAVRARRSPAGARPTCSLGVAELAPAMKAEDLVAAADRALYAAKAAGRDRVAGG